MWPLSVTFLRASINWALNYTHNDILVSVTNQQNLASLVQLVIALGALPSLLPGVGLSMSKRSKFYETVFGI